MASFEPYNLFAQRRKPSDLPDMNVNGVLDAPQDPVQQVASQMAQGNYPTLPIQKNKPVPQVTQSPPVMEKKDPEKDGMDYLASMWTSPEEEERMRKASVNRQRILAVGDALRHIGNIYNTVRYAPNQQFNNPVADEYNRYNREKSVRDAANQRYLSYQQAKAAQEQKARQWEQEFGYKKAKDQRDFDYRLQNDERTFGETKRKNDAYIASQDASRERTQALTEKTRKEGEWVDRLNEDKLKNSENQRWARAQKVAQGWANFNLSVSREERIRRGASLQGVSKDRELYSSPDGSSYSFPKGTINTKNINQIYGAMSRLGVIKDIGLTSDGAKWDAIMDAAGSSKQGHDAFIYHAKRLGYKYEGGMRPEVYESYWGTSNTRPQPVATPKPQPKPSPKPQPKPKPAAVPQGTPKPVAKPKAQGNTTSKGRTSEGSTGPYSGFSIHKK